jgi:hypothetical protein
MRRAKIQKVSGRIEAMEHDNCAIFIALIEPLDEFATRRKVIGPRQPDRVHITEQSPQANECGGGGLMTRHAR